MWATVICAIFGYLVGSISTAVILSNAVMHNDIRDVGSGNAGATNMLRTYGWNAGLVTMGLDIFKGILATGLGCLILGEIGGIMGGFGAVIGHVYPLYFGFKGGKGITVTIGMAIVLTPISIAIVIPIALILLLTTRIMSLSTLTGNIILTALCPILYHQHVLLFACYLCVLILNLTAHRENIKRLLTGCEKRLDWKEIKDKTK